MPTLPSTGASAARSYVGVALTLWHSLLQRSNTIAVDSTVIAKGFHLTNTTPFIFESLLPAKHRHIHVASLGDNSAMDLQDGRAAPCSSTPRARDIQRYSDESCVHALEPDCTLDNTDGDGKLWLRNNMAGDAMWALGTLGTLGAPEEESAESNADPQHTVARRVAYPALRRRPRPAGCCCCSCCSDLRCCAAMAGSDEASRARGPQQPSDKHLTIITVTRHRVRCQIPSIDGRRTWLHWNIQSLLRLLKCFICIEKLRAVILRLLRQTCIKK